ncbi:PadR family transcriptional regulator [Bacillus paranthracis]
MDHTLKDTKNAIFFVEKDGKPVKIAAVKDVEFNFNIESKQSVEIPREISISCKFEIPENVKELMGMGFTPQQAWNIHFRQSSKWKVLHDDLTNEQGYDAIA